jgi:DNA modification methylase
VRWKESKRGEVYELGRHRLMCGDAVSSSDVAQLLGGRLADMCFTDPPYNVDYTGKTGRAMKIQNDRMTDDAFRSFLRDAFLALRPHLRDGAPIYVCHADKRSAHFSGALWAADFVISQVLVWVKSHFALGRSDYHYQHEPILYGWKPGARHTWHGGRKQRSVWFFPKSSRNLLHPTMKPVALVTLAIENSSQKGDVVLDTFGGSGTTLIAAEDSERTAYLMEIDPAYCDVIRRRYHDHSNKQIVALPGSRL